MSSYRLKKAEDYGSSQQFEILEIRIYSSFAPSGPLTQLLNLDNSHLI